MRANYGAIAVHEPSKHSVHRFKHPQLIVLFLALVGSGCDLAVEEEAPICFPLDTQSCVCEDGQEGVTLCGDDATWSGACLCPDPIAAEAPVAASTTVLTDEDVAAEITMSATVDEGELSYEIAQLPEHGSLSDTRPFIVYTPEAGFHGTDSFSFLAEANGVVSNLGTITIHVSPLNDAPVASDIDIVVVEEGGRHIDLEGYDQDGDRLTFSIVSDPENGVLHGVAPGLIYLADPDFSGDDSFTYQVSDGQEDSNIATVSITVLVENDSPTADFSAYLETVEGGSVAVDATALTPVDDETDVEDLIITIVTVPDHGELTNSGGDSPVTYAAFDLIVPSDLADSNVSYDHDGGERSNDSFILRVEDGDGGWKTIRYFVEITAVNDDLVLDVNKGATAAEGGWVTIDSSVLSASDVDNSAGELQYEVTSGPDNGSLSHSTFTQANIDAGEVSYAHDGSETSADSFTFDLSDGAGSSIEDTDFALTIRPTNDAPSFTSEPGLEATEDQEYTYAVTASDPDDGASLIIEVEGELPPFLTFFDNGNGTASVSGTPTNEHVGYHRTTITLDDGLGGLDSQSWVIRVENTNDAPEFTSDPLEAAVEGDTYQYWVSTTDVDAGDTVSISIDSAPDWLYLAYVDDEAGTALLTGVPGNDDFGTGNSVTLIAEDDDDATDTQEFTIDVVNSNSIPYWVTDEPTADAYEDAEYSFDIAADDDDIANGDSLVLSFELEYHGDEEVEPEGWLELTDGGDDDSATGTLIGTPIDGQEGDWRLKITATDEIGKRAVQVVWIYVENTNDAPEFGFPEEPERAAVALEIYTWVVDIHDNDEEDTFGDPLVVTLETHPAWLELVLNDAGDEYALVGTPPEIAEGDHFVALHAVDRRGLTDDLEFVISVAPAPDRVELMIFTSIRELGLSGVPLELHHPNDDVQIAVSDVDGDAIWEELSPLSEYELIPPLGFWPLGARGTVSELEEVEFTQLYGAWAEAIDEFETEEASDDTMETAGSMVVGEAQLRTLFPATDTDYIAVELDQGARYDLLLAGFSWLDVSHSDEGGMVELLNEAGEVVWTSSIGMDYDAFEPPETGTYYVRAQFEDDVEFSAAHCGVTTYVVIVQESMGILGNPLEPTDEPPSFFYCHEGQWADYGDTTCWGYDRPDSESDDLPSGNSRDEAAEMLWYRDSYNMVFGPYYDASARIIMPEETEWFVATVAIGQVVAVENVDGNSYFSGLSTDFYSGEELIEEHDFFGKTGVQNDGSSTDFWVAVTNDSSSEPVFIIPAIWDLGTNGDGDEFTTKPFNDEWDPEGWIDLNDGNPYTEWTFEELDTQTDQVCVSEVCFVAGTMVATKLGGQAIETLEVGDIVLSRNETTGLVRAQPIITTHHHFNKGVMNLTVADQIGRSEVLTATPNHPFWVIGQGWVEAGQLRASDGLLSATGEQLTVQDTEWLQDRADVYNIRVRDDHTYFVGDQQVWVHNY